MNGFKPGIFLRGVAMGAADVVPGVSGGTIAFITGIYDDLLNSLKSFNLQAIRLLLNEGPLAAWRYVNGAFLLNLFLGILCSVISLAKGISYALEHHPVPLAAFFFGLVLASAILVYQQIPRKTAMTVAMLLLGALAAFLIGEARPANVSVNALSLYLSGALAICAMILPGISGSFILLLIGMYSPVIDSIKTMNIGNLMIFGLGCATGLMLFVRLLSWLMSYHRAALLAFLTGLLLGSLNIIWPWKLSESGTLGTGDHDLSLRNVWPGDYAHVADPQWLATGGLVVFGVMLVLLIERVAHKT